MGKRGRRGRKTGPKGEKVKSVEEENNTETTEQKTPSPTDVTTEDKAHRTVVVAVSPEGEPPFKPAPPLEVEPPSTEAPPSSANVSRPHQTENLYIDQSGRDYRLEGARPRWRQEIIVFCEPNGFLNAQDAFQVPQEAFVQLSCKVEPVASGSQEPVASGSQGPVASGSQGPVASGSQGPVASGSQGPVASGSQEPVASGSQEPVASGSQGPVASGSQEPVASGSQEPVASGIQDPLETGSLRSVIERFRRSALTEEYIQYLTANQRYPEIIANYNSKIDDMYDLIIFDDTDHEVEEYLQSVRDGNVIANVDLNPEQMQQHRNILCRGIHLTYSSLKLIVKSIVKLMIWCSTIMDELEWIYLSDNEPTTNYLTMEARIHFHKLDIALQRVKDIQIHYKEACKDYIRGRRELNAMYPLVLN